MRTIPSTWIRFAVAFSATACLLVVPTFARGQQRAAPRGRPTASAPRTSAPAPVSTPRSGQRSPSGGGERTGTAVPRDGGTRTAGSGPESSGGSTSGRDASEATPRSAGSEPAVGRRERGDRPVTDTAVPRRPAPGGSGGGGVIIVPGGYGFYPWGYGGLGLVGYYGGYYDPYDPYGYGGYGGGYGPYGGGYSSYSSRDDDGAVRIKVTPREASVYVDGYYVGHVDDFDGVFQRLHLAAGPHRLEMRAPQYEPLMVDVRIDPDQTITYRGEMRRIN